MPRFFLKGPVRFILISTLCLSLTANIVTGYPHINDDTEIYERGSISSRNFSSDLYSAAQEHELLRRQGKVELRILPLGASIVYGVGSSDGNG